MNFFTGFEEKKICLFSRVKEDNICFVLVSEREDFQVFVDKSFQGSGAHVSNLMDLFWFLLIFSRMHLIIDLDRLGAWSTTSRILR